MTEVSDGILSKIRGLLAQAEHPNTTGAEAETFMAAAMRLMAKYGVERTALAASDPSANVVGDRIVSVPAPYAMGKLLLLNAVCQAFGVRAIQLRRRGELEMHLFGLASDLERVDMMFTSLLLQAARFMEADKIGNWHFVDRPKSWTRDWQDGYRNRVYIRLMEAEARARKERPTVAGVSTELVFVRKDELVAEAVAARYPKLRTTNSTRRVGAGYGTGDAAGQRADLGGSRIGGAGAAAIGGVR